MSTQKETIEYILNKLGDKKIFSARAMFGEYALYAEGVVVALVCDDQLYVKDMLESVELRDICDMDAPYPGAKNHYLVEEHLLGQISNLSEILLSISKARNNIKRKTIKKVVPTKTNTAVVQKKSFMEKSFSERVVELALKIPSGKVSTYGNLARAAGGGPMSSQSITGILGKAYQNGQKDIPFHRIIYSDGRIWTSKEHDKKRKALYKKENIEIDEKGKIQDFKKKLLLF